VKLIKLLKENNLMIKKNTKVIFEDGENESSDELVGGMPLSKGDIVHVHRDQQAVVDYEVVEKTFDLFLGGEDPSVNIIYKLKRK
jgi:hypothetical protein